MKYYLQRVRINSQGYSSDGVYWGIGQRLYCLMDADGVHTTFFRTFDRQAAKAYVKKSIDQEAKFFS